MIMAMDEPMLGKWYDKAIKAFAGHHPDPTGDKSIDRLALDNYLVHVEAAVPPLATVLQLITTLAHMDEAGLSVLLLRVFQDND